METAILLSSAFIVLVGLQMCIPVGEYEKIIDKGRFSLSWCPSPIKRIIYGLLQLIGVIYVLATVGYLTFAIHWWYILVYLLGIHVSTFISKCILILLRDFIIKISKDVHKELYTKRVMGTSLIILGILGYIIYLGI